MRVRRARDEETAEARTHGEHVMHALVGKPARLLFRGAIVIVAILFAGCARDPWPGTYDGTLVADGRDCATGEPVGAPSVTDQTITIDRDGSGRLFTNGRCLFTMEELSDTAVRFQPVECDTTLSDGTPVHAELVNGRGELDGDEVTLEYAIDVSSPTECLTASATFIGTRR